MFEIGNTLREARVRRGLDILACEAETKIRAKYLRAMEEEQFDLMPSPTYVRGFLRAYAEFLDLDGQLVLDEYESRFIDYEPSYDAVRSAPAPRRPSRGGAPRRASPPPRPRPQRRRRRTELQLLWLAIGGVMTVALLVWLGVGGSDTPTTALPTASGATVADATTAPQVAEPDTSSEEGPVRTKKTRIVLTGTGDRGCWVQVKGRNADGRTVFEQILGPGESKEFRVDQAIWIRAANPAGLLVTVGGKPTDLDSTATGNWVISAQGAKSVG